MPMSPHTSPLPLLSLLLAIWLGWVAIQSCEPLRPGNRTHQRRQAAVTLLLSLSLWWPQWLGLPAPLSTDGASRMLLWAGAAWLSCLLAVRSAQVLLSKPEDSMLRGSIALAIALLLLGASNLTAMQTRSSATLAQLSLPLLVASLLQAAALVLLLVRGHGGLEGMSAPTQRLLIVLGMPLLLLMMTASPMLMLGWRGVPLPELQPSALSPDLLWLGLVATAALSYLLQSSRDSSASDRDTIVTLRQQQSSDVLTGLPNRTGIEREMAALATRSDKSQSSLAVMVFNLDGFQSVNNGFGHEFGDLLLRETASRLRGNCSSHEICGRLGSDEFVLLMPDAGDVDAVSARARRFILLLSQPFRALNHEAALSCSVGIAFYPEHGAASRLLGFAALAAQDAKRLGGACFAIYDRSMAKDSRGQVELLTELRQAIARNELQLFFQPKIDAISGQVTAAEALLRWNHPSRGVVSPTVFIPVAERFGLMRELGNWVITAACTQARIWREHGLRMRVAINLSAHQMRQADLIDRIAAALKEHRIQPSLLTCEITESVAMEDTRATQETFRQLGELGVHLSIDDFGTGYSSLAYLRQLPAKELKIDRSFVTEIDTNSSALTMVDAIVRLAHALNLRVVAEGVETERQQKWLLKIGCDELQGYLFAKPMSAEALLLWAAKDEESKSPAFRASLFGETQPQQFS